jgi:hypothetical protein
MNIDDRLRAASTALKESSVAQVDAASRLQEIVRHTGQPVAHGRTAILLDEPQESPRPLAPSLPPAAQPRRMPQRLALVVNLLLVMLVLALGIVVGKGATPGQDVASTTPAPAASTVVTQTKVRTQVPEACIDAAQLADDVIARLNRNQRDSRLASALRDYTIASQACRRAASP